LLRRSQLAVFADVLRELRGVVHERPHLLVLLLILLLVGREWDSILAYLCLVDDKTRERLPGAFRLMPLICALLTLRILSNDDKCHDNKRRVYLQIW